MNVEENRLNTFTDWPANATVEAARIAKAGFYYSGHALEVQCFLCGVKISDWNYGDQAIARHRLAAPDCPFVQNPSATCNVPFIPSPHSSLNLESSETQVSLHDERENRDSCSSENNEHGEVYKAFLDRLQTFFNWPASDVVSPEKLAKAGFFYLQYDDQVQCAYCKGTLQAWKCNDNPYEEHRKHFPHCNFYNHLDAADSTSFTNVTFLHGTMPNNSELGIQTKSRLMNPDRATYEGRLQTFNGWPDTLKQTPEMLASAGFFYNGSGDSVTCFNCDGGLRNWEETDNVWVEHARWFPKCEFVNLVRGKEFIKECVASRPPLDESIFEGIAKDENVSSTETNAFPSQPLSDVLEVVETDIEKLLQDPPAMVALEIGLDINKVRNVLQKRIAKSGKPYTSADELVEDVLCDQIAEELTSNDACNDNGKDKLEASTNQIEYSRVPYDSKRICLEKRKHVNGNETTSLEEENRRLKEARLCKICMDREVAIVFLPCGHLATCAHCAPSLTYCPMCRQEIKATVRTFLS